MSEVDSKPDLMQLGTRYDHYVELREVFAQGVTVIDGLVERGHATLSDTNLRVKLEGAVEVINKRLAYLSDFETAMRFGSKLPTEIRALHLKAQAERERNDANDRRTKIEQAQKNSNQVRPEKDSGGETANA